MKNSIKFALFGALIVSSTVNGVTMSNKSIEENKKSETYYDQLGGHFMKGEEVDSKKKAFELYKKLSDIEKTNEIETKYLSKSQDDKIIIIEENVNSDLFNFDNKTENNSKFYLKFTRIGNKNERLIETNKLNFDDNYDSPKTSDDKIIIVKEIIDEHLYDSDNK